MNSLIDRAARKYGPERALKLAKRKIAYLEHLLGIHRILDSHEAEKLIERVEQLCTDEGHEMVYPPCSACMELMVEAGIRKGRELERKAAGTRTDETVKA